MTSPDARPVPAPRRIPEPPRCPPPAAPRGDVVAGGTIHCHLVAFEGPDAYARAGGVATRVTGLARALVEAGFKTHLWFVGDPELPGHEQRDGLHLHRWCQWISRHHPHGVYDGEEEKLDDLTRSLPGFLVREHLLPALLRGGRAVVLAEEWQTADAVVRIDGLLREAALRHRVSLLWNANNTFGFDRVRWDRLQEACTVTTVSRFMRHEMRPRGVDALVIPNGIDGDAIEAPDRRAVRALGDALRGRLVLTKVARWDPDKRWLHAIDTVADLKRRGWRPLLVARGGIERHGAEVVQRAADAKLSVVDRALAGADGRALVDLAADLDAVDVLRVTTPLDHDALRVLYRASSAVLANSRREPFGLVGLEAMGVGALTCVGGTGEDYAVPGWNALLLQTDDPREFAARFAPLASDAGERRRMRRQAMATARRYLWPTVVRRNLLPALGLVTAREAAPATG